MLDVLLLALPVHEQDVETVRLFDNRFLVARKAAAKEPLSSRMDPSMLDQERLLLLEEGNCLRDQALAYCTRHVHNASLSGFGASSLATIQMVANGYGITLLPEIAARTEVTDGRIELVRFTDPELFRAVGLARRRTSPRNRDFVEISRLLTDCRADV